MRASFRITIVRFTCCSMPLSVTYGNRKWFWGNQYTYLNIAIFCFFFLKPLIEWRCITTELIKQWSISALVFIWKRFRKDNHFLSCPLLNIRDKKNRCNFEYYRRNCDVLQDPSTNNLLINKWYLLRDKSAPYILLKVQKCPTLKKQGQQLLQFSIVYIDRKLSFISDSCIINIFPDNRYNLNSMYFSTLVISGRSTIMASSRLPWFSIWYTL